MGWRNNPAKATLGRALRHAAYTCQALAEYCAYIDDPNREEVITAMECGAAADSVLNVIRILYEETWGALPDDLLAILEPGS